MADPVRCAGNGEVGAATAGLHAFLGHGEGGPTFTYIGAYKVIRQDYGYQEGKARAGFFRFLVGGPTTMSV